MNATSRELLKIIVKIIHYAKVRGAKRREEKYKIGKYGYEKLLFNGSDCES